MILHLGFDRRLRWKWKMLRIHGRNLSPSGKSQLNSYSEQTRGKTKAEEMCSKL